MLNSNQVHQNLFYRTDSELNDSLDDAYDVNLAINLIKARRFRNLTQVELAKLMSVSQAYIAQLESGSVLPSHTKLKKIARILKSKLSPPQLECDSLNSGRISVYSLPLDMRPFSKFQKLTWPQVNNITTTKVVETI